jgi:hypothetical protein
MLRLTPGLDFVHTAKNAVYTRYTAMYAEGRPSNESITDFGNPDFGNPDFRDPDFRDKEWRYDSSAITA